MLSKAQAAWVSTFLDIPSERLQADRSDAGPAADGRSGAAKVMEPGSSVRSFSLPSIPSLPDIPDPGIKVHVVITNQTGQTLEFVSSKLENPNGSEFETSPPGSIDGDKGTATIVVSNNAPYLTGVGGTAIYRLADEPKTTVSFQWERGRVPKRKATLTITPDDAKRFERDAGYDGDTFTFLVKDKTKKPDGPSSGVALSCRGTVVNQSKQTIFLRKQDNSPGGDFVKNPGTSIAPGGSTDFIYAETPNSSDHKCRGLMTWEIGDPKLGTWDLMWDNQKGAKNLSASFLKPDDGSFHTLHQIDQGDENVPVTFTLSGGGGAAPAAKAASCAITVANKTTQVLTRLNTLTTSGTFTSDPPGKIDPGGTAQFTFAAPADDPAKGIDGGVQWSVSGAAPATWQTSWRKPAGGAGSAQGKIVPDGSALEDVSTSTDGADGVSTMTFTLTEGDTPVPTEPDDEFAPPPKSKQPTLRIKDESPDGWIEYAQRLLNKWSIERGEAKDTVNGKFDTALKAKVGRFQTDRHCLPDGVIGNETWAALREGPKEKVGTDGRTPHTFEQTDAQARFVMESPGTATGYVRKDDEYFMNVVSTGEQPIDDFNAEVQIIQPGGANHTHHFKIGPVFSKSDDGQGNFHQIVIKSFSSTFGLKENPAKSVDPTTCTVDAYLPKEIGGDRFTGPVIEF